MLPCPIYVGLGIELGACVLQRSHPRLASGFFETGCQSVTQTGLELMVVLMLQLSEC